MQIVRPEVLDCLDELCVGVVDALQRLAAAPRRPVDQGLVGVGQRRLRRHELLHDLLVKFSIELFFRVVFCDFVFWTPIGTC